MMTNLALSKTTVPSAEAIAAVREQVADFGRLLFERHLTDANGGNLSVRVGDGAFMITASGVALRDVTEAHLILLDTNQQYLAGDPSLKPSKETGLHLAIYAVRPDVCRACMPGDPECLMARARHGM